MASPYNPHIGSQDSNKLTFRFRPLLRRDFPIKDVITSCPTCHRFVAVSKPHGGPNSAPVSHHYQLVFTDGACPSNGSPNATAGLGIAYGTSTSVPTQQLYIPVDDALDPSEKRTNQRAKLLAAIEGLERLAADTQAILCAPSDCLYESQYARPSRVQPGARRSWIVATDSKHVVCGMTDWLPNIWKHNGMRTMEGKTPANLDLFFKLEDTIARYKSDFNVDIGFWLIPREFNGIARAAAVRAPVASPRCRSDEPEPRGLVGYVPFRVVLTRVSFLQQSPCMFEHV
ncbi:hypothetical protein DAEQUDRAFT_808455 [Daedalea quercina L-15889]|uniref:ribonuclease H n=1 Tax=Daedalea quercina L-15889 TaxID=1314783 RepID=A0A165TFF1_9APHY|nr:hypothetical protein DAEQUDRAFT_808455 [Daedalea quercina L-15889]